MSTFPTDQEVEPYRGLRALHNADLHTRAPSAAPRQEWLIVRRPGGAGGWDEDHLTATEQAAHRLVREAEAHATAMRAELAELTGRLRALAPLVGCPEDSPLTELTAAITAALQNPKGTTP